MTTAATEKVYVIRLLPVGNSPAARTERANLQASKWMVPSAPKGEAAAGRPYRVTIAEAVNLLRKGWTLCDAAGKPVKDELPKSDKPAEIRPGTAEWFELPLDQRPGTEEFRAAELERLIHVAYLQEQQELSKAHGEGKHAGGAAPDCPLCDAETAAAALKTTGGSALPLDESMTTAPAGGGEGGVSAAGEGSDAGAPAPAAGNRRPRT